MRLLLIIPLCLAGCDLVPERLERGTQTAESDVPITVEEGAETQLLEVEGDDRGADSVKNGPLGRTVASLGDAAEPGLWLKTPLVTQEGPGRVTYPATGKSAVVMLIPIEGPLTAGSRLSLQAMQALGAPLTDLPEIEVSAGR